ncbi:MAG: hypothetical protein CVV25_00375 [Ignavibacteriae bacterium HGW-Ignavibacteriae-4]|jgi:hypothetical protein|nr:MAG: hypothetical protein CVV25_00375 [Ignavibacteriae bacterium HGW-Ignavibacteriae-4]
MEILLAIVWYLALIMPGNYYTMDNIYDIGLNNRTSVEYVANNNLSQAMDFYNTYDPEANGVGLPAYWDKEPVDHTDESLNNPWDDDIRRDPNDTTKRLKNKK